MTKSLVFTQSLVLQQLDVVEEELTALLECDRARRLAIEEILGLRQNPRVAKNTASDENPTDASGETLRTYCSAEATRLSACEGSIGAPQTGPARAQPTSDARASRGRVHCDIGISGSE